MRVIKLNVLQVRDNAFTWKSTENKRKQPGALDIWNIKYETVELLCYILAKMTVEKIIKKLIRIVVKTVRSNIEPQVFFIVSN